MEVCLQGKLTTEEETLDRKKVEGCWARGQNYSIVIGLDLQPVTSWSADLCALFTPYCNKPAPGLSSRHDLCQTTKKSVIEETIVLQYFLMLVNFWLLLDEYTAT
jgi:hypothetical protein